MSDADELARRRVSLRQRIAGERITLNRHLKNLSGGVHRADHGLALVRNYVFRPATLVGAIAFVLFAGRRRSLGLLGTGVAMAGSLVKLRRMASRWLPILLAATSGARRADPPTALRR